MEKNNVYSRIKEQLVPDEAVIDELHRKLEEEKTGRTSRGVVKIIAAAACVTIVVGGIAAYAKLSADKPIDSNINNTKTQVAANNATKAPLGTLEPTKSTQNEEDIIKGLPVDNFKLVENSAIAVDRTAISKLTEFYIHPPIGVVIAKAIKGSEDKSNGRYIVEVEVMKTVAGEKISSKIKITQSLNTDFEDNTNLLRDGGVYLLPVSKDGEFYSISGDMDVLFEIDDKGNIYSHSRFNELNKYDGQKYSTVADMFKKINEDADTKLICKELGYRLYDAIFAGVTVVSDKITKKDYDGLDMYSYKVKIVYDLGNSKLQKELELNVYNGDETNLVNGKSYIATFTYNDKLYNVSEVAELSSTGIIMENDAEDNMFNKFSGCTLEKLNAMIDKAKSYN